MTRWWDEFLGLVSDWIAIPMLAFVSLLATILIALGWYFWPSWLPWRWAIWRSRSADSTSESDSSNRLPWRLGRLRWRWRWRRRRKPKTVEAEATPLPDDVLPDLPAPVLALSADQLAAAGRYAEAVRERLRSIVRDLVDRGLVPNTPGWTVTELARTAIISQPATEPALAAAVELFSEIWYGLRPAHLADDTAMRAHAAEVVAVTVTAVTVTATTSTDATGRGST